MITRDELIPIGKFTRPHGVKGEVSLLLTDDTFDNATGACLVCDIDGIFVPFFMEEYRYKTDNVVLVKLERIDTVEQTRIFTNKEAYILKKEYAGDEEVASWADFVGFEAVDRANGVLGRIVRVDDTTMNVLFIIEKSDGGELFVPAHEDFIEEIDETQRRILMDLPEGLVD